MSGCCRIMDMVKIREDGATEQNCRVVCDTCCKLLRDIHPDIKSMIPWAKIKDQKRFLEKYHE